MSKYYKNAEGMVSGKLTAVKATHILGKGFRIQEGIECQIA